MRMEDGAIDTLLMAERRYPPPPELAKTANANAGIYEKSLEEFWAEEAYQKVTWFRPFEKLYEWDLPYARWFIGGRLNACFNCVDRHVEAGHGDKVAYFWEGEPAGERRALTFADLQREIVRLANGLKKLGVRKGTNVAIYMGMVPELPIAMLACARLGAPHTVFVGGFSAESLADRLNDVGCTVLITQDEGWRRGSRVPLKKTADAAMEKSPAIKTCIVLRRTGGGVLMKDRRDVWWKHLTGGVGEDPRSCPCEPMDSEDLLFLVYSSDRTGKPSGVMHTTGGYLVGTSTTHHYVFDINPETVYWCAADIGSIAGHSYIVYGPLCNQTTSVLYEGTPDYPGKDRWWEIVERYNVSVLYTSPAAIRTHVMWGPEYAERHDLSSLRLLGTIGEPIDSEAWAWYREHIGDGRCPVVDTWWQTETGMIVVTPLPGVTTLKPGSATRPFPGVDAAVYDDRGHQVGPGGRGYLVIKSPYPAMLRGVYNDPERFRKTYWQRFPGVYFTGEVARIDEDGDIWLMGRVDDREEAARGEERAGER